MADHPTPNEGEERTAFMARCVPAVMESGDAENEEAAGAVCSRIFDGAPAPEAPAPSQGQAALKTQAIGQAQNPIWDRNMRNLGL